MSKNIEFLIRPGQIIRVPRNAMKATCTSYSLLYRVNEVRDKWMVRVTRLDRHAPKKCHYAVSMPWLWRGRVVRTDAVVPSRLIWDSSINYTYRWALTHKPSYAEELERKYG